MKRRFLFFLILFLIGLAHPSQPVFAADSKPTRKVRMAFTSLSGSMITPWMAREAGIFAKHGLEVEVIATPSGVEGMNALIAGEVHFLQIAGGTTVSAALSGADVIILGTTIDTFVQNLMVRPEIEKPEQLKGKALGISRFGTSIDTGARVALRHFGLVPEKDVAIVRTTDSEMLSEAYDIYVQKHLLKVPLPSIDALKTVLEELAVRNPKAKEVDPRKFFDDSFVRQMQSSGFIDALYR